jgi:hypothetical protein
MKTSLRIAAVWLAWIAVTVVAPAVALAGSFDSPPPTAPPALDDALFPPPPPAALSTLIGRSRGPSQYMAGEVAVLLVLPESDGSLEPSTEDWTPEQIAAISAQTQAGLDWWAQQLPLANLHFTLRTTVAPTGYEPINHGLSSEGDWISDVFTRLGYQGANHFDQAYNAIYGLRDELGTDWATAIFVVNSEENTSDRFIDGRFAYAYVGGPFMVLTSDGGSYGTSKLASVIAHELGHSFGALDQYAAARTSCTRTSGYLSSPTTNSQTGGCATVVPSIMLEPINAFPLNQIDPSALAQVGYRDSDEDGLIDPLDTTPVLEATMNAPAEGRPTLSGRAYDVGFPSPLQRIVSINTITQVEYRVNEGLWQLLSPDDGAFDSGDELFAGQLPLYDGEYTLELRAVNSAGVSSAVQQFILSLSGLGPQPAYDVTAPTLSSSPQLPLSLSGPLGSSVQIAEQPDFAGAEWQPLTSGLNYQLVGAHDGAHQLFVRFRDSLGQLSLTYVLDVLLDTTPPTGRALLDGQSGGRIRLSAADEFSAVEAVEVTIEGQAPVWMAYAEEIVFYQAGAANLAMVSDVQVRFRDSAGNVSPNYQALRMTTLYLPLVQRAGP